MSNQPPRIETWFPKTTYIRDEVCLVQICDDKKNICLVKPNNNQTPPNLSRLLSATNVIKVFHFAISDVAFLKTSLNTIRKANGKKEIDTLAFLKLVKEKAKELGIDEKILSRQLNVGFSGGEKKKNEILQMKILDPNLIILDETDSGLDIDALKTVAEGVNSSRDSKKSFLVITHYQRLLNFIKPVSYTHLPLPTKRIV